MSFQESQEELNNQENVQNTEIITVAEEQVQEEEISPLKKAETWIVIVLFAILAIWFVNKQFKKEDNLQQNQTQQQAETTAQIAALEQKATENPTYENFVALGFAYESNGKIAQSIPVFRKALEINSNIASAYTGLGLAETSIRDYDSAIVHLTIAMRLDSASQKAKSNLKWAKDEKTNLFKGIEKQEKTPEDKRTAKFYIDLGLDYQTAKMLDKSVECCKKAVALEPKNELAYNNLGVEYIFQKKYDDAITALNKSIELAPDFQLAKNNLKWAQDEKAAAIGKK